MEMDDPWGSPWAEEVQIHPEVDFKPDRHDERPITPVRATTLALEEKIKSPWDDDAFGDWATTTGGDGGAFGFDGTAEEWEESVPASSQVLGALQLDAHWDNAASAAEEPLPKLSPSLLPKSAGLVRNPSLDPWATAFQDEEKAPSSAAEGQSRKQELNEPGESIGIAKEDAKTHESATQMTGESEDNGNGNIEEEPGEAIPLADSIALNQIPESDGMKEVSASDNTAESPTSPAERATHSIIPNTEAISSRPSSSPSEHSHHEENLPESPRTSIDDEPKRAWVTRKVSTKVQGLVEHFDSLAIVEEIQGSPSSLKKDLPGSPDAPESDNFNGDKLHASEADPTSEDEDDDFGDFGDFEEGDSENEEQANDIAGNSIVAEPNVTISQEKPGVSKKDFGPVTFDVDTTLLDEIYSGNDIEPSTETIFIPDRDLDNTLSSTEQRKMWYRISRYGTKRKHDTGDEDNYARVTWAQSQMRQDTLKIVARWMEEDRISGRVVLGGASKGSSVFGWSDKKAGPMPIAQAFAAKRGKKAEPIVAAPSAEVPREWPKGLVRDRSRSTSKGRSTSKPRRQSSAKSMSISEGIPLAAPSVPAADFGWNLSTKSDQKVKLDTQTNKTQSSPPRNARSSHRSTSSMSSLQDNTHKTLPPIGIPKTMPLPASKPKALHVPNPIITRLKIEEEDEDEWGEMVTSPVISVAPVLPILPKKELIKSPTFDNFLQTIPSRSQPQSSQTSLPSQTLDFLSTTNHNIPISQPNIPTPLPSPSTFDLQSLSSSPILSPQTPVTTAFQPPAPSAGSTNVDPWASVDFSFFDSPNPVPATTSLPFRTPQLTIPPPNTVKFTDPAPITPKSRSTFKSKEEIAQDAIVQGVIKDLPDLSYMFRR